eukprot:8562091-Pyramimonas_sp.AAC.1
MCIRDRSSSSSSDASHACDADLEPWVDWVRRATHDAEHRVARLNLRDWVAEHREAAVRWLGRTSTDTESWAQIAYNWEPENRVRRRGG